LAFARDPRLGVELFDSDEELSPPKDLNIENVVARAERVRDAFGADPKLGFDLFDYGILVRPNDLHILRSDAGQPRTRKGGISGTQKVIALMTTILVAASSLFAQGAQDAQSQTGFWSHYGSWVVGLGMVGVGLVGFGYLFLRWYLSPEAKDERKVQGALRIV